MEQHRLITLGMQYVVDLLPNIRICRVQVNQGALKAPLTLMLKISVSLSPCMKPTITCMSIAKLLFFQADRPLFNSRNLDCRFVKLQEAGIHGKNRCNLGKHWEVRARMGRLGSMGHVVAGWGVICGRVELALLESLGKPGAVLGSNGR